MSLTVQPILPRFGAEVSGIDLSKPISPEYHQEIVDTMDKWGICVYRDTGLDDDSQVAFGRIFGHLELTPLVSGKTHRLKYRELFDVSNIDGKTGGIMTDDVALTRMKGDQLFHHDSSFMPVRTSYSLLLAHEVPQEAGETFFADTRSAYEDLPQAMKDRIEHLECEHSYYYSRMCAGFPLTDEEIDSKPKARQPLVLPQASTGRKALYIGSHACDVVGMPRQEGRALIRELIEWATQPQYVFGLTYSPGDLVIWDNLTSMHRSGGYDVRNHRRDMRRATVREGTTSQQLNNQHDEYFGTDVRLFKAEAAKLPA